MAAFSSQLRNRLGLLKSYVRREARVPGGKKIVPLSAAYVPKALSSTHEDLGKLRHRVFGHKDARVAEQSRPALLDLRLLYLRLLYLRLVWRRGDQQRQSAD